ncbi:ABC transporter substrate-binding protein [Bradyrhizobium monzae]|uniref:ABC transporter substrate-binding protein n=1 Tax=Bradyrhizobium sp. Oc8 TaxID=2876780 RepID=UPI001F199049|nr:ABC transporter substrate-binding protein [Bradyrhizobium sp. Oc8]
MFGANAILAGAFGGLSLVLSVLSAFAGTNISDDAVKIGILNDQSGPYADLSGQGSVAAAQMAIDEFGGTVLGKKIELLSADHQNKADIGLTKAREWFDRAGVDVVADFSNSSVGFAVQSLAKERNKVTLIAAASSDFTGKVCSATSAQWVYTSYSNGYGLAKALVKSGYSSWFLVTVDYAFGQAFAADIRKAVAEGRGQVLGEVRHPLNTSDMSSYLLQAQSSKAKVIALASAGADMATGIKQAAEFGITDQSLVAPIVFITDVHSLGLAAAKGLKFVTAFYWDRDEETRVWSRKFFAKRNAMPTMTQAGVYSAVRHYLRAVEAAQTDEGQAVMSKMKELPVNDIFSRNGRVREDGLMLHDMYLVEVKQPSESKAPWDYYKILATIPADQAFPGLEQSECPLVRK